MQRQHRNRIACPTCPESSLVIDAHRNTHSRQENVWVRIVDPAVLGASELPIAIEFVSPGYEACDACRDVWWVGLHLRNRLAEIQTAREVVIFLPWRRFVFVPQAKV